MPDRKFGQIAIHSRVDTEDTVIRFAMALQEIGILAPAGFFITHAPRSIQQVYRDGATGRFQASRQALN